MTESFPRQSALTQAFSLGVPRSFEVAPDGSRVAFLRSQGGTDPVTCLWLLDVATGQERLLADPAVLGTRGDLTEAERALRERTRERAAGITSFATDAAFTVAVFALAGQAHAVALTEPGVNGGRAGLRALTCQCPAFDPRPDPTGRWVAYVCDGALRVTSLAGGGDRELIGPGDTPDLTFGMAEFIAAEEMDRMRGYWWAPDGSAVLAARVDSSPVQRWYIADPANPSQPPRAVAYPAAGTANADVSLVTVGLDGGQVPLEWDRAAFPYLVSVDWGSGDPLVVVQSRDQRRMRLLTADPRAGTTALIREDTDPDWVDIVVGVPARTSDGRIVWTTDDADTRRLLVAAPADLGGGRAEPVTPPGLQLREVRAVDGDTVLFTASGERSAEVGLWAYSPAGLTQVSGEPGVHTGTRAGGTTVVSSRSLASPAVSVHVHGKGTGGDAGRGRIASLAEEPALPAPAPDIFGAGPRAVRTALLLPSWHTPGSGKLPVLMDPYGGPHGQRVYAAQAAYLTSQWFAEQGFAVVVADGRGTPGRGPAWDRSVHFDYATPVLADQVDALHAAAQRCGDLDLGRVAIRGWSFGGYLAALAVLRRPDVFHAAVSGAPVTDERLYDTHYSERYLGHPDEHPEAYDRCSPLRDAEALAARGGAGEDARPLMLIHGLADDNVVVAHTLRLSAALLAAGYQHTVLPLTAATHMASQPEVAENLLLLQVEFLRRSLGMNAGVTDDTV